MKKIKTVMIGTGHDHAPATFDCLTSLSEYFDFVGCVFIDDGFKAHLNLKHPYFNGVKFITLEDAFAIPDLECAVIETDDNNLTKYAKIALERGLAVQMDKPGGQNHEEFIETLNYAKEKGLVFHTGYMYRYNPAVKKAISLVKSGALGDIYSIEAQMSCYLPENKREWLKNFEGGMINFLGCHLVDVIYALKGVPNEVLALSTSSNKERFGKDVGLAVLNYDNCLAIVKSNCMEMGGPMRRKIVIVGEKGSIEINPTEYPKEGSGKCLYTDMRVVTLENNAWHCHPEPEVFGPFDRYQDMFIELYKIINGEIENPYSIEYEIAVHEVLLKACGVK